MNERVESLEQGIEIRHVKINPKELDHVSKFRSDRSFYQWVAHHSYTPPRVKLEEILSVEIREGTSERLPVLLVVERRMGHYVLSNFVTSHEDCTRAEASHIAVIPGEVLWKVQCSCGEETTLRDESFRFKEIP